MPDLVALDLPAGPGWVEQLRRAWDQGDAVLPLDTRLVPAARRAVVDRLGASVVVDADGRHRTGSGRPVAAGDALVMATSGTTGVAKGVILTHDAVAASAAATSDRLGVDPGRHRWVACLPLAHVGGVSVVTRALATGAGLTVLAGFDRQQVLDASGPEVLVSLVPTTLARVGAGHWHTVVLGGSAPPGDLPANVVTTYGLTETGSGVVYDGLPLDGVEVDVDPATSEIRLRGPMLLRAYRAGPDGAERPGTDPAGWLSTGDAGRIDGDGRLRVEGRLSDLIVTGGENVWPTPVERILARHPGVAAVAVAGRPDPEWGEAVWAWVVPTDPADPPGLDTLRDLVRSELAGFAAPRRLVLVERLPTTSIGKVQRNLLPG